MANIDFVKNSLLVNPNYSDEYITALAELIVTYGFTEEEITEAFGNDASKLNVILDAEGWVEKQHPDPEVMTTMFNALFDGGKMGMNSTQLRLIFAGIQNDVPYNIITELVSNNIPFSISNYTLQAWIQGHDMRKYVKDDYGIDQIYEIYAGLVNGIDVSIYDKRGIEASVMGLMRHAIEIGLKPEYDFETKTLTVK